jgi:hypothetical protein
MLPKNGYIPLSERCPFRLPTGWALFFSLFSLIEKGKQCNNQTTKGYQQANNPYDSHFNIAKIWVIKKELRKRVPFSSQISYFTINFFLYSSIPAESANNTPPTA